MGKEGVNKADICTAEIYSKPPRVSPKNKATEQKWWKMYEDYAINHYTQREIAEKYGMCRANVHQIIKWCVFEVDTGDYDEYYKVTDEKLTHKLRRLEDMLKQKKPRLRVSDKLFIEAEHRRTLMFQARIRKVLNSNSGINVIVPMGANVPVKDAPDHRTGAKVVDVEAEEVESDTAV